MAQGNDNRSALYDAKKCGYEHGNGPMRYMSRSSDEEAEEGARLPSVDSEDCHVESDSGGAAARELRHPRSRAQVAFHAGRQSLTKRRRDETVRIESQKRKERRYKAKKRKLLQSSAGCSSIVDLLNPSLHAPAQQHDLSSRSDPSTHAVHGIKGDLKGEAQHKKIALDQSQSAQHAALKGSEEIDSAQARLDFISSCKRRTGGGSHCPTANLATRFLPPCPLQKGTTDPVKFMILPVNVLSPLEQFPLLCKNVRCSRTYGDGKTCGGRLKSHGWSTGDSMPRRIFSMCGDEYVVVRVYRCTKPSCNKDVAASNKLFFASLPDSVQQSYGFVLSRRGGITRELADRLMDSYVGGLPFESLANDRNSRAREMYLKIVSGYVSVCALSSSGIFCNSAALTQAKLENFGAYDDESRYGGRLLSAERLSHFYKSFHASRRDLIDRSIQSTSARGQTASFDDTFKLPKKIRTVGGKLYSCLKTLKSSEGCILYYGVAEQKGAAASAQSLKKVGTRLGEEFGMHTLYSDQCCVERATFLRAFPSLASTDTDKSKQLPPLSKHANPLVVVTAQSQLSAALQLLRQSAMPGSAFDQRVSIALDAEWTAGINSGSSGRGRIGVVQFSTVATTVVIDLTRILARNAHGTHGSGMTSSTISPTLLMSHNVRHLPTALKGFLEDKSLCFVGVCIKNDCAYLAQDFGVSVYSPMDMRTLYKNLGYSSDGRKGTLAFFVELLLKRSLPCKNIGGVRTSCWSEGMTSIEQQEYAATDAWATAQVYAKLLTLPKRSVSAVRTEATDDMQEDGLRAGEALVWPENSGIDNCNSIEQENLQSVEEVINDEPNRSVKLDAFHFMQRLVHEVREGASKPVARLFAVMLSMAIFEESNDDREAVQAIAIAGGATKEDAKRLPRSTYKHRVRRMIPVPSILKRRILAVYSAFEHIKTAEALPFFKSGIEKKMKAALSHVESGCLSDSPHTSLYTGTPGEVMTCGRGSSALESFHRHLTAAFPGFSYGAELFDALLSEYVFRTNARAKARVSPIPSPHSIAEIVSFERLNALCLSLGFSVPESISNGQHPLPANNGEVFGLEDLGDWARKVRKSTLHLEDDASCRLGNVAVSGTEDENSNEGVSIIELGGDVSTMAELVQSGDFKLARMSGRLKASKLHTLLRSLRGTGASSSAFLSAVCGGERVGVPTSTHEIDAVKRAMAKETELRCAESKRLGRVRKSRNCRFVTDFYNEIILKENERLATTGESTLLCSTTPKQIALTIASIEDVSKANSWLASGAKDAARNTLTRLELNVTPKEVPWANPKTTNLTEPLSPSQSERTHEEEPGTYQAAFLSCEDRVRSATTALKAVGSISPSAQPSNYQRKPKPRICRHCKVVLGRDVPALGHPKKCPSKTKAAEIIRERKGRRAVNSELARKD